MNSNVSKIFFLNLGFIIILIFEFIMLASPAKAYTGGVSIFPPLLGGPDHKTVTNFPINTNDANPQSVITNLNYVQAVVIETNPLIKSHLLISEYPSGDDLAFSFTVPKPFQDALIRAHIYFWGPDVETLQIWHIHKDETPVLITANRVEPVITNPEGDVLWVFTTTSFSDFFTSKFDKKVNNGLPLIYFSALIICCFGAAVFFKKT